MSESDRVSLGLLDCMVKDRALVTFSGRQAYRITAGNDLDDGWFKVKMVPEGIYGMYPGTPEAVEAHQKWCQENAQDPFVDEIPADTYVMNIMDDFRGTFPFRVIVRNPSKAEKGFTLEISLAT